MITDTPRQQTQRRGGVEGARTYVELRQRMGTGSDIRAAWDGDGISN